MTVPAAAALLGELERRCKAPACFGHLAYIDAPEDELVLLANKQYLRIPAARAFLEMSIQARKDAGINLLPAYGFRRWAFQRDLFVKWAQKKKVGFEENLRHVAPPGYSEHHTGYAVDIHDGPGPRHTPDTPFHQRPAYAWLLERATEFDFELSFPRGNVQGIMFEAWHWRWVGDEHAHRVFETARSLAGLDAENDAIGEALRSGKETGIPAEAAPEIKRTLATLIEAHGDRLADDRAKLESARKATETRWAKR